MRPTAVGIDISDRSIEAVSLLQRKGRLVIFRAGRRELPPGLIERGVIQDADGVVRAVSAVLDETFGPKRGVLRVAASLPATVTYAKSFTLPASLGREQLRKAAALEGVGTFPLPPGDTVGDVVVPSGGDGSQGTLYVAAPKAVAESYRSVLSRAGCHVTSLVSEDFALAEGLGMSRPSVPALLVDIGNRTTLIALLDRGGLRMSGNVPFGATSLRSALEQKLKVSGAEAEKIMSADGFDPSAGGGRAFFVLQQPAADLIRELHKTITYAERRFGAKVRGMVLAGGTSPVPGLVDYLAANFQGLAVGLGNPLRSADASPDAGITDRKTALPYATALGLAAAMVAGRGGPAVNLLPDAHHGRGGPFRALAKLFSAIIPSVPMATHAKKSLSRKKKTAAVVPQEPVVPPAAGPSDVMDMTPPELVSAAVSPPELVDASSAGAESAPLAAAEPADEPDFGLGIGDILRSEEGLKEKITLDAAGPSGDDGKLSIEDILSRADEGDDRALPPPPAYRARPAGGSGKGKVIALVLLVLLCFGTAAAGVYAFVKKNGLPSIPFLSGKAPSASLAPSEQEAVPGLPSTVNVTVRISASEDAVAGGKPALASRIIETDVKASDSFAATGEAATVAGKSSGRATIINATSREYTFVATTRLLSKEGVLFRMQSASVIPANGSVDVDVAADQPGPEGDIGPTTFTIPGLPPDLQKQITAKSDTAMTGGSAMAKAASAADIAGAKAKLEERLKKDALANFGAMLAAGERLEPDLVTATELSAVVPKAGAIGSSFVITLSLRFRALLVPERAATALLEQALREALPAGSSAADFTLGAPLFAVQAYDTAANVAEIRVEAPVIRR